MFGGRVFEFMTPRNKLSNATKPLLTAASCSSSSSTKAARRVLCYCASILFLYFLDKPPVLASFEEVIQWATGGRSQSKQSRFAHAQQLQFTQVGSGALRAAPSVPVVPNLVGLTAAPCRRDDQFLARRSKSIAIFYGV